MVNTNKILNAIPMNLVMILGFQIIIIVLFGLFADYDESSMPGNLGKDEVGIDYAYASLFKRAVIYLPLYKKMSHNLQQQSSKWIVFKNAGKAMNRQTSFDEKTEMENRLQRIKMALVCLFVQGAFIVVFIGFVDYEDFATPSPRSDSYVKIAVQDFIVFQDIHIMIFIGFGFLMTFLKKYSYSAVGFNLLLAAIVIQWAMLCRGFFNLKDGRIQIGLNSLMDADISSAAVLISMGALLGRTTFLQLIVMGIVEIPIFMANEHLLLKVFKITDVGGSIIIHTFGAYFGLAVSFMLRSKKTENENSELEGASYNSDVFAMIGTLFLWICWPSFNAGLVTGDERFRAIINTYLSLATCTVVAFVVSSMTDKNRKFDMVHVQNSTLAGGVAMGAVCNLVIHPYVACLGGFVIGIISVLGYKYLSPKMASCIGVQDTCGVHNLHGMPGIFSGLLAVLFSYLATEAVYKDSLYTIFPAMDPSQEVGLNSIKIAYENMTDITVRSSGLQAGYQVFGLLATLGISILGGVITGLFLKSPLVGTLPDNKKYDDKFSWELSENHNKNQHSSAPSNVEDGAPEM